MSKKAKFAARRHPLTVRSSALAAAAAIALTQLAPSPAQAASGAWNVDAAGNWITAGSWTPAAAPGSTTADNTDIATFGFTLTAARIATVDATRFIGGISFGNTSAFGYTLSGGSLRLNNGGVIQTLAANGAHTDTISTPIQISGTTTAAATFTAGATAATSLLSIGAVTGSATATTTTTLNLNGTNTGGNAVTGIIANGTGGALSLTKSGTGTWVLSGANTYTGLTTVSAGALTVTNAAGLGTTAAGTSVTSGAALQLNTVVVGAEALTLNGTGISAGGALRNLAGTSSYAGAITLGSASRINSDAGTMTLSGAMGGAFALTVGGAGTTTISGAIGTGAGTLTKDGTGVLILSGANTYSGVTTVSDGTLRISNASALGTNTAVTVNQGVVAGGNGTILDLTGTLTHGSGKTVTFNSNSTGDFRSTLLNSANNNTWAGNIVAAGTGIVAVNAATGTTLTVTGGVSSTSGAGTGTLFTRGAGTVVYNGVINLGSDRIFSKTDAGTVIVNSTGNSWVRAQVANGQIQIGANNALANTEFTFGQTGAGDGRLELNSFSQTVTRLNTAAGSTATNHILRNSNLTTASTLTFATPNATTDTLTNLQVQGTASGLGTLNLVSNGLGRTEFNGGLVSANSWTVNSGTLAFTGANNRVLPGSVTGLVGATIEKAGASTLAATSTWNNAGTTNVVGGALVLGAGTAGAVNVSDLATLSTGLGGGVLSSSAVTFGTAGATTYVPLLTTAGAVAPLNAFSLTTAGTTVTIAPQAGLFTPGTYRLLDYTGSIGGNGFGGFALAPVGSYPHITAALDNTTAGQVNLVVTAADSLIWAGQTNGVWDVNTTSNFALASSTSTGATFYQGDAVVFGDTHDVGGPATPVTNSTITGGAVTIGNLTFNNSAVNYSVANPLSGAGGITKTGTGAVTLSGASTYAGATSVSNGTLTLSGANVLGGGAVNVTGGTLRIGNSDALRGAGSITVSGGGTFDANGTPVGTRYAELVVSGVGVGGNGAIVNNGAAITNNSHFAKITLSGNTTWGGSGRYDLVAGQIFNGGAFTLTKTGTGDLWYNPSAGSVLENVIVNGGVFGSQGANPLSATATVTVNSGGLHQIFGANAQQHNVVLNDGGILRQSNNAAGTINGQVTLSGTTAGRNIQAITGGTLNIAGKLTGTGGFTVNEAGTVQLQNAANDYAGDTVITLGTLNFSATGIMPATTNLIVNGGTFATGNLPRSVGSLSGTGGTISGGNNLTTNQSTATTWSGILSGTNLIMNGAGTLTLAGTADNSGGIVIANSGTTVLAKTGDYAVHATGSGNLGLTINSSATVQIAGSLTAVTGGSASNNPPADITIATPPSNYVDQIFNLTDVQLNTGGTLDLNGRLEAIDGLAGGGTVTNTSATTARLYVGYNNTTSTSPGFTGNTSTFSGVIQNGASTTELRKIGTGMLVLSGANTYTGATIVDAGTLNIAAGGSLSNTPITVNAGTLLLDGTHGTGPIAVNGTSVFAGAGTSGGTLTAATGTTVQVGAASAGTAATTLTLGGLTLNGGTNLNLDFNTAGTTLDKIATTATNGLSISGANPLNVVLSGAGWVPGTYSILTYAGAVQGTGATNATLVLSTPVGHSTVNVVDNGLGSVNLVVAGAANKWVGGVNNIWDTNNTLNWNAGDQKFLAGDSVVFDDTATSFTPNILANQTAAGVTFDNTTAYTLTSTGTFGIAGTGGLIKKNTGTVTISSANTYTGSTDVQQGTLIANFNTGTAQTVFAAASTINVASGATFKAVANDSSFTLANNLTGSGLVVIDPHLTAGAAVRDVTISGNNAGFTGTLRLSPTVIGDGLGTFRTNQMTPANAGGATIDVDAGGQAWLSAATFTNNFILTGHGFAETAGGTPVAASGLTQYSGAVKGGIGAIRMNGGAIISGNITLDGSAKIMPYNAAGTISGSISITNPTDTLVVGGGGAGATLILTGTNNVGANALNQVFVNAGGTAGTNILAIGANGTVGTLGTGAVTLNGDAATGAIRFDRADGYTLAAANTITSSGTTTANTRLFIDTQGTGFVQNGVAINLGGGALQFGTQAGRTGATGSFNGNVTVGAINVGTASTGAVMNILPGANIANSGNFFLGEAANMSGTVIQSGGDVSVGTHVRVGHFSTNTSAYTISAGTLTVANINTATDPSTSGTTEQNGGIYLGIDGTGTMAHSGGTVTTDWIVLDNRGDTPAGTNMPDGIDRYTLSGSGLLVLRSQWGITQRNTSAAVTLAGGTIRNGGTNLQVRLDTAPDISGAITLDTVSAGNSFNWTRNAAGAGSLALSGGGTLKFTTTTTQSVAVPVSGTGALEKLGTGTTTLGVANTYNGTTTITNGTLQVGAANAIPSGAGKGNVVFSAAATSSLLDLNGFDTSINGLSQPTSSTANLVVNNATGTNKTLTLGNNDATATFAGIIANNTSGTGTLALTKVGTGTQTLSGASTFTGPITVNGGQIAFPSSPATSGPLGNSTVVNLNNGSISYTASGTNALNRSLAIGAGNGTVDVALATGTLTVANLTSTGGNLVKTGAGTLALSGTTTLNGGASSVTVSGGTLQAGFGTNGVTAVSIGATSNLSMQNSAIQGLTLGNTAGALTLAGGARLGFEFDAATNDSITIGATGTPSLTAGVITLDLFNFNTGIAGGNTYNLLSTTLGDLTFGGLTTYVLGSAPSGFNYTLNATNNLVSLGVSAFSPAYWTDSQGTGSWSTLNAGPLSNFSTLATGGANTAALPGVNETVFFSQDGVAGPTVTSALNGNFTIRGLNFVAGSGTVTAVNINQGSSGTLTIQPSTATGGIDVGTNAGAVTISAPLVASNTSAASQTWNVDGTGANGSSLTLNGVVTFTANVIKTGSGTLTLGNAGNSGAGNFTLTGGTLAVSATGNVPTGVFTIGTGTTINNTGGGTVAFSNSSYVWNGDFTQSGQSLDLGAGPVTLGLNTQVTVATNTLTVGGAIGDGGNNRSLTKAGAGTLVLGGTNTYTGATSVTAGTVSLTGALTGGGAISTSGTGVLSQTSTGVISGASTITQGSSGTSVMAGNNTHAGLTSVTAGVLTLSGNNSGASGGVTLTAGQLNINNNNALGTGTLTLNGGTIDNTSGGPVVVPAGLVPTQIWSNTATVAFVGSNTLNLGTGAVALGTDATTGTFTLTNNSLLVGTSLTVGGSISAIAGGTAGVKTLTIAGPGSTALTGSITKGSASNVVVTVTSPGTTTLSGAASSIQTINIDGGATSIVDLGAGNLTITNGGTNGFRSSTGGTINATGGGKIILGSDLLDNGTNDGTTLTVNAGITGPFTFEIYGGSATNTGVTVLTAQNTFTGNVQINGGNLRVSNIGNTGSLTSNLGQGTIIQSGAAVLAGSTVTTGKLIYTGVGETTNRVLTMSGAGFAIEQAATSGHLVFIAPVSVTNTAAKNLFLLGSTAGTAEIAGVIPNNTAATSITKLGSGTWTLSGANTYTGTTNVNEGTLVLSGRGTGTPGIVSVSTLPGLSATLNITAGTYAFGAARMNVGNAATTAATGTVNQSGGAISFTGSDQLLVGQGTVGNTGIYNLSGGSITTAAAAGRGVILGVNSNPTPGPTSGGGTFNLSGTGALNMTAASGGGGNAILQIGRSDAVANNTTNVFNQTGGTASVGILAMGGAAAGSTGVSSTLNLTGGTFLANSFTLLAAGGTNTAVINIGGTAQVTLPAFPTNAKGVGSTATITFDSGTGSLSPLAASATYMPAGTFNNAYLTANGAKFNVGTGNDITIGQVLQDAVSPAAAGTLTKQGTGMLTLTGANTYTGQTTITAGTLAVTGSISSSTQVLAGGTLAGNGQITEAVTISAGGSIRPGVPGGSITSILTVKSLAMVNDPTAVFGVDITGITVGTGYDQVTLPNAGTSTVSLAGASLSVKLGTVLAGDGSEKFVIINNTSAVNTPTGQFSSLIVESSPAFGVPATTTLTSANGGLDFIDPSNGFVYTLMYNVDSANTSTPGNDVVLSVVPEPGSLALAAMAGVGLLARRRRR
ncbi:autotransporter-associated beta strand repeat-containing protein [Humisphaera borealis]|uniref:Autotransporter-associated beta strand repeat-containing protein n=1 Tax=Humisphaera borealis TaxID=2807512 RepID=A0A7M2WY57_9BACT|nr:autotransporter-associated beta strand repeat-containing protein [Humisphaera borealis]QOV89751.1 autotransporter-associated beta strand repeat-containing protein [Humisphaera borealis]